ncbi:fumarate hydratase [Mesotoga sp. H07.pep.5.3]|uniref:fumarate hydratase n=1 Tax=Mesotoga sp. H07.pep.5.3 TaxID=1421003 RepID=UPI000C19D47B|nr:fumarate hydratase [Mesotoga sp. H07.pep.5.3]PIJ63309.1 fumarate hydratase [Mesotoga sp. H07.pep.5.3]
MIDENTIVNRIEEALVKANTILDNRARAFLNDYTGPFSAILRENAVISEESGLPLCQDTGFIEFFVFMGHEVILERPISEILDRAVRNVYSSNPYRYSVVADPFHHRENTGDNTPSVVHTFIQTGKRLEIRFLVKGGGSENLSRLFMLNPTITQQELVDTIVHSVLENGARGCPPLKIGIGIGGSSEKSMILSKLALTREINAANPDPYYAMLEERLLREINNLGIGFQGLGKGITAYSVSIETAPTHIATLPVSLAVDCYLCRRGVVVFED